MNPLASLSDDDLAARLNFSIGDVLIGELRRVEERHLAMRQTPETPYRPAPTHLFDGWALECQQGRINRTAIGQLRAIWRWEARLDAYADGSWHRELAERQDAANAAAAAAAEQNRPADFLTYLRARGFKPQLDGKHIVMPQAQAAKLLPGERDTLRELAAPIAAILRAEAEADPARLVPVA